MLCLIGIQAVFVCPNAAHSARRHAPAQGTAMTVLVGMFDWQHEAERACQLVDGAAGTGGAEGKEPDLRSGASRRQAAAPLQAGEDEEASALLTAQAGSQSAAASALSSTQEGAVGGRAGEGGTLGFVFKEPT